jgi:putative ABC transport system ATP-binding protein
VPDEGELRVDGTRIDELDDPAEYRAATVGFVFQFHELLPTLDARENVQLPMLGRGLPRSARERRAGELLDEVGLAKRVHARPATLSAGERQRVAVARALANEPRLLLADEPTGALDSETGEQVIALLQDVRRRRGTTLFVVTHDAQVAGWADRVLHLRDGVIRAGALESAST